MVDMAVLREKEILTRIAGKALERFLWSAMALPSLFKTGQTAQEHSYSSTPLNFAGCFEAAASRRTPKVGCCPSRRPGVTIRIRPASYNWEVFKHVHEERVPL